MRKIILFMHMTIDGFIAGPNNELDFANRTDMEMSKFMGNDLAPQIDSMILGRELYQGFHKAWPAMGSNPNSPKEIVDFAHWIEDSPKYVITTTLDKDEWKNSVIIKVKNDDDVYREVKKLKTMEGKDIVLYGGARIAQTLVGMGLVDEYRFKLEPYALGKGKALFKNLKDKIKLKLVLAKSFDEGTVVLYYQPK